MQIPSSRELAMLKRASLVVFVFACLATLFFSLSSVQLPAVWSQHGTPLDDFRLAPDPPLANNSETCMPVLADVADRWASSRFLKGAPTRKFKGVSRRAWLSSIFFFDIPETADNLLDDAHYITTFSNAGFSQSFVFS